MNWDQREQLQEVLLQHIHKLHHDRATAPAGADGWMEHQKTAATPQYQENTLNDTIVQHTDIHTKTRTHTHSLATIQLSEDLAPTKVNVHVYWRCWLVWLMRYACFTCCMDDSRDWRTYT